jgi:hypothetical protein
MNATRKRLVHGGGACNDLLVGFLRGLADDLGFALCERHPSGHEPDLGRRPPDRAPVGVHHDFDEFEALKVIARADRQAETSSLTAASFVGIKFFANRLCTA